ncbi:hypothetical protein [Arcicella aurantiaca]|nr:hypothetical protein [Arcicella aurantiaca]
MNNSLNTLKKLGRGVLDGVNAVRTGAEAYEQAKNAFGGMGNTPNASMLNPSNQQQPIQFENDGWDNSPQQIQYDIDAGTAKIFRKKAEMKADLMILNVKKSFLFKRIIAKLIVTNKGDDEIFNTHKDLDYDEIKDLPQDIQKIIRNQKHVRKIESVEIDEILRESCIEYFVFEFEEDYRNGINPDFSGINPVELIYRKFNEPFDELIGDLVLDFGLAHKEKGIEFGKKLMENIMAKVKKETPIEEEIEEQVLEDSPSEDVEVIEEGVLENSPEQIDDQSENIEPEPQVEDGKEE